MKIGQTAKAIDNLFPGYGHNKPSYFGECTLWNDKANKWEKVNSTFIARKYSQILKLVQETKANVSIKENTLIINTGNFTASIGIDKVVSEILIPEIKQIQPIN